MKTKLTFLAMLGAAWIAPTSANILGLDFEGIPDGNAVGDYYDGVGGPDLDVQFRGTARAAVDSDQGGTGGLPAPSIVSDFTNEPSHNTVMYYDSSRDGRDPRAIVNFLDPAGFTTGVSFFYSQRNNMDREDPSQVILYDQLDGMGNVVGILTLHDNWQNGGCDTSSGQFCNWDVASIAFGNEARSIVFSGAARQVLIDNLTLGSTIPVPLPAAVWLLGSGLLGFAAMRRRRLVAV